MSKIKLRSWGWQSVGFPTKLSLLLQICLRSVFAFERQVAVIFSNSENMMRFNKKIKVMVIVVIKRSEKL